MTYRIGIDIGGTFTDFALINDLDGSVSTYKRLTSADDPSIAVMVEAASCVSIARVSGSNPASERPALRLAG